MRVWALYSKMQGHYSVHGTRGIAVQQLLELPTREVLGSAWRTSFARKLIALYPLQLQQL